MDSCKLNKSEDKAEHITTTIHSGWNNFLYTLLRRQLSQYHNRLSMKWKYNIVFNGHTQCYWSKTTWIYILYYSIHWKIRDSETMNMMGDSKTILLSLTPHCDKDTSYQLIKPLYEYNQYLDIEWNVKSMTISSDPLWIY